MTCAKTNSDMDKANAHMDRKRQRRAHYRARTQHVRDRVAAAHAADERREFAVMVSAVKRLDGEELFRGGEATGLVCVVASELEALEAENAALREFVAAVDDGWRSMPAELGLEPSESESAIRQRLATDHGLPLSGAREADDGNDEYGYCDTCGEPLIFASMCTCASCVHELHS